MTDTPIRFGKPAGSPRITDFVDTAGRHHRFDKMTDAELYAAMKDDTCIAPRHRIRYADFFFAELHHCGWPSDPAKANQ